MDKEKQIEINCNNCKRQHTRYCPNSSECMSLPNLPYFETDVIRLLEHDWSMHEKKIYEIKAENERLTKQLAIANRAIENMCMEQEDNRREWEASNVVFGGTGILIVEEMIIK